MSNEPVDLREAWNRVFTDKIIECTGLARENAEIYAPCADDSYDNGDDPVDAAYEELSCWDDFGDLEGSLELNLIQELGGSED
jgi:hypothetical protein